MNYVYDIVLNFQDKYYDFYEWLKKDKIINIKKIPIFKINNNDYLNIKNDNVIIENNIIKNKICLLTSGLEVMAIMKDNNGKIIKKSSLIFEESDDILKDKDKIKQLDIKYKIIKKNKTIIQSRIKEMKLKYITNYLKNKDKKKDEYLLKYLYYEIYGHEEENIDTIYNDLIKLSHKDINKIYENIKKINAELKQ